MLVGLKQGVQESSDAMPAITEILYQSFDIEQI